MLKLIRLMVKKVSLFDKLTPALVNILEKEITKALLIKLIGQTVGFKAWLLKFAIEEIIIDEIIEPGVEYVERKVILFYDKVKGHYVYKELEESASNGDLDAWRAAARRM